MNTENIVSDLVFKQLQLEVENTVCFDCGQPQPQWASVNNGSFICMNCAALHRSMGVQTSFVRSLSMDTWSNDQLKLMALGGNKKLRAYFQNYDLNDESVEQRYTTRAAEYYRLQLRQQSEGIVYSDKKPSYELGREQVPVEEMRSPEEIMHNNPPFQGGGDDDNQYKLYPDVSKLTSTASSYLSWAGEKAKENVYYASDVAKKKGEEYGVNEKVSGATSYVQIMATDIGSKVKTQAVQNAAALQQSAQEGTLTQKAQENAKHAASNLYGFGSSLYSSASNYMYGAQAQQSKQEIIEPNAEKDYVSLDDKDDGDQIDTNPKPSSNVQ